MRRTIIAIPLLALIFLVSCTDTNRADEPVVAGGPSITGEEVTYSADGLTMQGYLAYDAAQDGERPGVLVVHEWWGHNDYARRRAEMLAEMGYTALAVDMYGDGKTADHPDDARAHFELPRSATVRIPDTDKVSQRGAR